MRYHMTPLATIQMSQSVAQTKDYGSLSLRPRVKFNRSQTLLL